MLRAQFPDAAQHFRPLPGQTPPLAIKQVKAAEVGVASEEFGQLGGNPPVDGVLSVMGLEQSEHRKRLDHIAE
jgi:hypothetical protein